MTTITDLFPSRYLAAADLEGHDKTVTIRRHDVEEMFTQNKRAKKPVLYFNGEQKGMVLNKTNALIIAELYGETLEDWRGKAITLYPAEVEAFGRNTIALRVRPSRPAPKTLKTGEVLARWNKQNEEAVALGIDGWEFDPPAFDTEHPGRWWVEELDRRADRISDAFDQMQEDDEGEPALVG